MTTMEHALVKARAKKAPKKKEQTLESWIADARKEYPKARMEVKGDTASFYTRKKSGLKLVATWNDEKKSGWIRSNINPFA